MTTEVSARRSKKHDAWVSYVEACKVTFTNDDEAGEQS